MVVSGIVLVVFPTSEALESVTRSLDEDDRIDVGVPAGFRIPLVLETESDFEARQTYEALQQMPGVSSVHLTMASVNRS